MEHANGHHEGFFSPTTATYVELLNAAGLVASAARGEPEQRRMLGTFNNVHASYPKTLNSSTQYRRQQEYRSSSHRSNAPPRLSLGPPLKQMHPEALTDSHTTRDFSDHPFLESPETPRAPFTPDALTASSGTYFDSVPVHLSRSSSFPSASPLSILDSFEPPNVTPRSRDFSKNTRPPTILNLARRLARSPSQTSQLSNQELEAVEDQFSWLEDAISDNDDDPFGLDQQFTPKQRVPARVLSSAIDPDDTPRLLPAIRTPLISLQSTPLCRCTQRVTDHPSSLEQRPPSRSSARLRSPGPPPDLPLPPIPLYPSSLPPPLTTPHTRSRTRSRSRSIEMPPVPPLPVGLGLGLPTKIFTGSKRPRSHAPKEGAETAGSIFRNRSHTSGVDRLPSQTKEETTFLVEERHSIQASRARAVSGGSGLSRGLMRNQRAEFRKNTTTIPILGYNTDLGRRESDTTSVSSATGSEVELLQRERDERTKGWKGKTRIW